MQLGCVKDSTRAVGGGVARAAAKVSQGSHRADTVLSSASSQQTRCVIDSHFQGISATSSRRLDRQNASAGSARSAPTLTRA